MNDSNVYSVTMSMRVVNEHDVNNPIGSGTPALFVEFVRLDDDGNKINEVLFPWTLLKDTVTQWIELEAKVEHEAREPTL